LTCIFIASHGGAPAAGWLSKPLPSDVNTCIHSFNRSFIRGSHGHAMVASFGYAGMDVFGPAICEVKMGA